MKKLTILFLCVFTLVSAVPAAYADDKGFFERSWDSVTSYFSDDEEKDADKKVNDASLLANLPPDPGAAGKATLEGIDSDNDGVRDDVQRWIALKFPNSEKTRAPSVRIDVAFSKLPL